MMMQTANPLLKRDQWHHIAVVMTLGQSIRLFVDGSETPAASSGRRALLATRGKAYIGVGRPTLSNNFFGGQLDDFRLYPRALGASEIDALAKQR